MRLKRIVESLGLEVHCGGSGLDREVKGGYVSDLMSDVIAHAEEGDLWVTLQTHANVVAVAAMKELAAVVLIGGRRPEALTAQKAEEKGVPILGSPLPAFELVGRLHEMGLKGRPRDAEGA